MDDVQKICEILLQKHVNPNIQNKQGLTPLHKSIMADNRTIFDTLIENESIELNLKSTPQEHTPLYYALVHCEMTPDLYIQDDNYALKLIKSGAQSDYVYSSSCDSLLQTVIKQEMYLSSLFLLKYVKNINHANSKGETALHYACLYNVKIIKELLNNGALGNCLTDDLKQTALHYAVKSNNEKAIEDFIEFNVDEKINFNIKDSNGDTPLSLALLEGYKNLVPILIRGNADVNVKNGKNFTLLHQAIMKEDSSTAIFLLDNGADMNAM